MNNQTRKSLVTINLDGQTVGVVSADDDNVLVDVYGDKPDTWRVCVNVEWKNNPTIHKTLLSKYTLLKRNVPLHVFYSRLEKQAVH